MSRLFRIMDTAPGTARTLPGMAPRPGPGRLLPALVFRPHPAPPSPPGAALAAGYAYDDRWWLPEVLRRRAAYDDAAPAIARLRCAAQMASEQGSAALLGRCERDLAARGVRPPAPSVPPVA